MTIRDPQGITWDFKQTDLGGKTALVTGGTTGIGRGIALLLAANGVRVVIFGRHQKELDDALADLKKVSPDVFGLTADASKEADIERVFSFVDEKLGTLDILINNAGLADDDLEKMSYGAFKNVIDTNVTGYIACAQKAIERMKKNKGQAKGHIVNIGSMSADQRGPSGPVYVASKAAIQAMSESFRKGLGEEGIKVTLIEPGAVGADMQPRKEEHAKKAEKGEMLKAEDIAMSVVQCLMQPWRCDIITVQIRPHKQGI